jgi:hypothetical protein
MDRLRYRIELDPPAVIRPNPQAFRDADGVVDDIAGKMYDAFRHAGLGCNANTGNMIYHGTTFGITEKELREGLTRFSRNTGSKAIHQLKIEPA